MTSASVLLVGDVSGVAAVLEADGHALDRVDDGDDALEHVAPTPRNPGVRPDIVVAAAELPTTTGFELAAELHGRDDLLPVVVVGSESLSAVAEDAMAADLSAYLQTGDLDEDRLRAAVVDAAETHLERRDRARIARDAPGVGFVLRQGTVASADPAFADLLGTEAPGDREFVSHVADDDRDAVAAALRTAGEDTETVRFSPAAAPDRTLELRVRRSPADRAIVADASDATEEADRLAHLEREGERLDSLLENVPMSIYFKDRLSRHERVSHYITRTDPEEFIMNAEGKVHPHPDDLLGKTDYDLYAPGFAEQTMMDDRHVMEDEEPVVNEIEAGTTSLGEEQYTSTTKVPRYDEEGNVIGLVGVTIDVTDRIKHRQELERQNERLNEFAEVLTHDLRNPLNIAQGYLEVLATEHDEEVVDECSDALTRIEALIEEIRAFVLEGRTVKEPEAVDLEAVAGEAWSTVDTGDSTLEVDGEITLRADADRLRTLLENLFRNAIEHGSTSPRSQAREDAVEHGSTSPRSGTPEDAVEHGVPDGAGGDEPLTVRVVADDDGFAVEDDGAGLSEEAAEHAFERGFTTSSEGTGFGLAIVRNIAEAHGWEVDAGESETGGACFAFSDVVRAEHRIGTTIS